MGIDMLVLLVGMRSGQINEKLASECNLKCQESGFMQPRDSFLHNVESNVGGVFYAGAVTAPKNVGESINEGTSAAHAVVEWLNRR
jgi:heterodisulfide reductase subunit A